MRPARKKSDQSPDLSPVPRRAAPVPESLAQFYSQHAVKPAPASLRPFGGNGLTQTTLAKEVGCEGVGLHSGAEVRMVLKPAAANSGIVFIRRDAAVSDRSAAIVPALFSQVRQSTLCSSLGNQHGTSVGTVEHVMAALAGLGVDNALIELDGPEVPIMDGSAAPFVAMIDEAGLASSQAPRRVLKITRPVRVESGDSFCALSPSAQLTMESEIDFAETAIGRQRVRMVPNVTRFRSALASARTFCCARDVATMRAAGLALGGSLNNAVVVDGADILNEEGLRYRDEFVRHKLLDALGDMYLAGLQIVGHYRGRKAGHTLHNKLLHAVFAARAFALLELTPRATVQRAASRRAAAARGVGAGSGAAAPLAAQSAP